tara:strand:+ start:2355 stop:3296 length:942 start_codon:yes stop_codon:yes gene_type:complete
MPIYECQICNYKTKIKSQLTRHHNTQKHANNILKQEQKWSDDIDLNKKEPKKNSNYTFCQKKEPKKNSKRTEKEPGDPENPEKMANSENFLMEAKNSENICEFCGTSFKTRHIMLKHIRLNCKSKKEFFVNQNAKDKEIQELKSQVKELISKVGTTMTTINNQTYNQQTNVQQNNVNLNVFGKEDLSMLTDDVKRELIKGPYDMMPKLMEMVYFNKEYPQNHTLKLVNKNKDILKIYDKNGWKYVDKDSTVDYILEDKNCEVDDYYDLNAEEFTHFVKNTYKDFRRVFDSRDKELWKKIKRDVDLLLWNNMKN